MIQLRVMISRSTILGTMDSITPYKLGNLRHIYTSGSAWWVLCSTYRSRGNEKQVYFVTLLSKDEAFLSVCPITSVQEEDFYFGIFVGVIRYSEGCSAMYGVPGPRKSVAGLLRRFSYCQ